MTTFGHVSKSARSSAATSGNARVVGGQAEHVLSMSIHTHPSRSMRRLGRQGDLVTVVKMQKALTGTTYYAAAIAGDR
jgi:hypothetical protein